MGVDACQPLGLSSCPLNLRTGGNHFSQIKFIMDYYNGCNLIKVLGEKVAVLIWGTFEGQIVESCECTIFPTLLDKKKWCLE